MILLSLMEYWYAYNNEPVLKDINLKIKKGQTVAIVGKSEPENLLWQSASRFMTVIREVS